MSAADDKGPRVHWSAVLLVLGGRCYSTVKCSASNPTNTFCNHKLNKRQHENTLRLSACSWCTQPSGLRKDEDEGAEGHVPQLRGSLCDQRGVYRRMNGELGFSKTSLLSLVASESGWHAWPMRVSRKHENKLRTGWGKKKKKTSNVDKKTIKGEDEEEEEDECWIRKQNVTKLVFFETKFAVN